MTITTTDAAELLGVSESRVRHMAREGKLTPLNPGSRPLAFREAEVVEWEYQHRRGKAGLARLAERWRHLPRA